VLVGHVHGRFLALFWFRILAVPAIGNADFGPNSKAGKNQRVGVQSSQSQA
jgi:hypothetical protein